MKTYMVLYIILDYIFDQCKCEEDGLAIILGGISPYIWKSHEPTDKAMVDDWNGICGNKEINEDNIKELVLEFLCLNEELGFSLTETKRYVSNLDSETMKKLLDSSKNEQYT